MTNCDWVESKSRFLPFEIPFLASSNLYIVCMFLVLPDKFGLCSLSIKCIVKLWTSHNRSKVTWDDFSFLIISCKNSFLTNLQLRYHSLIHFFFIIIRKLLLLRDNKILGVRCYFFFSIYNRNIILSNIFSICSSYLMNYGSKRNGEELNCISLPFFSFKNSFCKKKSEFEFLELQNQDLQTTIEQPKVHYKKNG